MPTLNAPEHCANAWSPNSSSQARSLTIYGARPSPPYLATPSCPRFYRTTDRAVIDSANPDHELTWLEAVYSNKTLVTQITPTDVTSSGTMPGLLAKMLTAIRINTGDNVLHVGTGTGYTAALLC